jgi:hypothetical protein
VSYPPWRWKEWISPKLRYEPTGVHCVVLQKTTIDTFLWLAVRIFWIISLYASQCTACYWWIHVYFLAGSAEGYLFCLGKFLPALGHSKWINGPRWALLIPGQYRLLQNDAEKRVIFKLPSSRNLTRLQKSNRTVRVLPVFKTFQVYVPHVSALKASVYWILWPLHASIEIHADIVGTRSK